MVRRKFTKEFKFEAVKLVTERGVAVAQAARDLDLAEEWAAMADLSNYAQVETDDGKVGAAFQPSDERMQQAEEAGERLAHWNEGF